MSGTSHAYSADRLFDGERFCSNQAVIIEGDRIAAVVPTEAVPADVPVVEVPGGTILPGLIDTHVHFGRWQGPLYLAYGVTTVRDVGNYPDWILARRAEADHHPWPRIICVGPVLDGPEPSWDFCRACPDASTALQAVAETVALGVEGIKLYTGMRSDWLPAVVAETRRLKRPVMMHPFDAMGAIQAGVEELFHLDGMLDSVWPERPPGWLEVWGRETFPRDSANMMHTANRIAASGVIITPTLAYWDFAWRIRSAATLPSESEHVPAQQLAILRALPGHGIAPQAASMWGCALRNAKHFLSLLIERDVPILTGTDEPFGVFPPGRSLWREMELLCECGMKPAAVLRAATSTASDRLGLKLHGRLKSGCAADLVLLEGDPASDGFSTPRIAAVVRAGQLHRPAELIRTVSAYATELDGEPLSGAFRKIARHSED